jgi:hypothetical protein
VVAAVTLGIALWGHATALGLQFAGLYLPFLQELLHTQPLTGLDLAVVFLASTLGYAAVRLDRVLFRRSVPPTRLASRPAAARSHRRRACQRDVVTRAAARCRSW